MGLNDIQLSATQLAELYGRHLVDTGEAATPNTRPISQPKAKQDHPAASPVADTPPAPTAPLQTTGPKPLQYLGKNQKKVAILVNSLKDAYLPENELTFLTNVLLACQLNLGDVAIVNHARTPVTPAALREQLESAYVLVFGAPVDDPGLSQHPSFVPLAQNGYSIVLVPSLTQLNSTGPEAKPLKQKLWICLKQLFNV